jgi:hypothetical protein
MANTDDSTSSINRKRSSTRVDTRVRQVPRALPGPPGQQVLRDLKAMRGRRALRFPQVRLACAGLAPGAPTPAMVPATRSNTREARTSRSNER